MKILPDLESDRQSSSDVIENVMIALSDNFNTPIALSYIYNEIKLLREDLSLMRAEKILQAMKVLSIVKDSETIETLKEKTRLNATPAEIVELAEKRKDAKAKKDFTLSDQIRKEISEKGWKIVDTKDGYFIEKVGHA